MSRLTEEPVGQLFLRMTLPMMGGIYAMISIFLVDTYFISRLGTAALAAVSFTFPVTMILFYFVMGIGIGTASVVSRAIGERNHLRVKSLVSSGMVLTIILAAVITISGLLTIRPLFIFLGARGEVLALIEQFMSIWYIGIAFLVIPMVGNNIIRAMGDAKTPGILMMISAVMNLLLDPIFIFGLFGVPAMGIRGAAVATLIAFLFSTVTCLMILAKRERLFCRVPMAEFGRLSKEILHIGLPSAVSNVMIHLAIAVIVKILAPYGKEVVAGFGIATRVESLAFGVYFALSSILGPFVGQNWGAGKILRVQDGLRLSTRICLVLGIILAFVLALYGGPIARIFDSKQLVIAVAVLYLVIVPLSYWGEGIIMMTSSTFNALGNPYPAAGITLLRMFVLYIPLAYLGKHFMGIGGVFAGAFTANVVAGWLSFRLQEARVLRVRPA